MATENVIISVDGMVCMSCVNSIQDVISQRDGVTSIKVSLEDEEADIVYDQTITTVADLVSAIEDMGFDACEKPGDTQDDSVSLETVLIDIQGMKCKSCVNNIESTIGGRESVHQIKVSLEDKNATIDYDSCVESPEQICNAICEMGFDAFLKNNNMKTVLLAIEGMTCQSCVKTNTEVMSKKDGVKNINVSLEKNNALIEYDSDNVDVSFLCQSIEEMGFDAYLESTKLKGNF